MVMNYEEPEVLAVKDAETERPIPSSWRPVIRDICKAFARLDYQLSAGIPGVAPVSEETATQIRNYVREYGAALIELPDETWSSSVCIWLGDRWDALVDLWTASEGRSDLVLQLHVSEAEEGFLAHVYMVYVP